MLASELRKKFLEFFKSRGHTVVPSSSLIPDDPSVLLTTAGMQQFKKYYTGEADPIKDFGSKNTASIQKSFRTSDIDEVGDDSHLTFFEMLGNFSFGGYFKKEAIKLSKDFFDSINLGIDYVTVFEGDSDTPFDEESYKIWQSLGIKDVRKSGREDNFWGPTGAEGPCGPTTEVYINGIEIWNIVFNQYYKQKNRKLEKLKTPGVDTGMGLERLAMVSQGKKNIFETDLFAPYFELLPEELPERAKRIIIDHLRGSVFLIADGVRPSNKEAGYILRRILRRIFVYEHQNKMPAHILEGVLHDMAHKYGEFYPELARAGEIIRDEYREEREKFQKALDKGLRALGDAKKLTGQEAFNIYQSFGLSPEIIQELKPFSKDEFDKAKREHLSVSAKGAEKKFGGHGLLLDTGELKAANEEELKKVTRLHTATHLLQAALRKVLGEEVKQAGSDITAERTRFDFTFDRKLTDEEIKKVEGLVNLAVNKKYQVKMKEMALEDALKLGALHFFKEKYPQKVKVYSIGDLKADPPEIFSRELCGGPHVKNTSEIGQFKILKQEAVGAGLRRIRATVD
ncbi:hypothetical protein A3B05_03265 [Candidatus Giovannonibacteria bacterium RIFCSPLOWO2_01_FULL_43_160]|uniref:alanine--tRNA ligase n=2 Tax=Candidatus Giovannoniibacteriota TaxID=1752738 RepID=A0A0G1IVF6_9BACT|nr:MAG: Alanine-tRNA ligase [Candidatus Giovannonibacteria bacterium GW2011_GWB1_43_13]KKS99465.1 MAG: Alanine-tRNA ligase [Candidatus Giovannonibacteria bacterium GW2011_GWA1_43_15]KKT63386.1 MAG: Alanine-tRNA ligase [Candidatus Giovannonibacteria bacterium GW2011_GWA2_44_26]OGF58957.1 MAG: hypothetical protein A2652_03195 [Candidatus Giovannonibacteria bacterium RIFCSPHIGHO2_01_FULL_43_140]OGF70679.1 MAG: hypothetical protein A3C76_01700 [Candidatus Giovannonibacteria bacterium RIFCSPHIGHO2_0